MGIVPRLMQERMVTDEEHDSQDNLSVSACCRELRSLLVTHPLDNPQHENKNRT
jgi:hypothetical protein